VNVKEEYEKISECNTSLAKLSSTSFFYYLMKEKKKKEEDFLNVMQNKLTEDVKNEF